MSFTLTFIKVFFWMLVLASPIMIFLIAFILFMGYCVVRTEKWKGGLVAVIYYSFITATTVGYGDFCPVKRLSRLLAIAIGFTGLIMTGIMVALALRAVTISYETHASNNVIIQKIIEKKFGKETNATKPQAK